jgi:putative (di)nucleoside polyphosphate hydrolase
LVEELLSDPLVTLVMNADRIDRDEARAALTRACVSLAEPQAPAIPEADLVLSPVRNSYYRAGVGILLFNGLGDVFVGRRCDVDGEAWQMPQGGIEDGEQPLDAALRELKEEIGSNHVEVLCESKGWLRYEWPPEIASQIWDGRYRGQQQKWFAMRFLGGDSDIDVATDHPEFSHWRWASLQELPRLIVEFKRPVYESVLRIFDGAHAAI